VELSRTGPVPVGRAAALGELLEARAQVRRFGVLVNQAVARLHASGELPGELGAAVAACTRAVGRLEAAAVAVRRGEVAGLPRIGLGGGRRAARADRLSGEHRRALAADCIAQGVGAWVAEQARSGHTPTAALEQRLARAVFDAMFGLGRLQPFADLPDVENIDVYGTDPVWLSYSDGRVEQGEPVADSDAELVELIQGFARYLGHTPRTFSPATPLLRMRVAGGHRLTAAMTVSARPQLTLRKHLLVDVTLDDLIELGTLAPPWQRFCGRVCGPVRTC